MTQVTRTKSSSLPLPTEVSETSKEVSVVVPEECCPNFEFKKYKTAGGIEHGLVNILPNSAQDDGFKHMKPHIKAKCEKLKKEEARVVKARYINHKDTNHGFLAKTYCHWSGQELQMWKFLSGYEYEVPYGLVTEVNHPIYKGVKLSGLVDVNEQPIPSDQPGERTHEFLSVGF